ncbi:MAG: nuclear transport factor 2 family protein [Deltaproteobacteria bacterium]|nr:nuclear transport factor 2 family protein [Deltaproteobacteria bacterium]
MNTIIPRRPIFKIYTTALVFFVLIASLAGGFAQNASCGSAGESEEQAVLKAVRKFLDAEIRRDYPAIFACFAPSSAYLRTHNYKQYLAEAKATPDRVVAYQIVRVSYIQANKDPQTISTADKIAQVEVEVTFAHEGASRQSVVNIGFIFLKEGGKWYKS